MTSKPEEQGGKDDKQVAITVNDAAHSVARGKISFDALVALAFGDGANPADGYRISYDRGHGNASGKLKPGASVQVVDGMDFTVTGTGQS